MLLNIIRILLCQNWTRGEREYLDHQLEKGVKNCMTADLSVFLTHYSSIACICKNLLHPTVIINSMFLTKSGVVHTTV